MLDLNEQECNQLMELIEISRENVRGVVSLRTTLLQRSSKMRKSRKLSKQRQTGFEKVDFISWRAISEEYLAEAWCSPSGTSQRHEKAILRIYHFRLRWKKTFRIQAEMKGNYWLTRNSVSGMQSHKWECEECVDKSRNTQSCSSRVDTWTSVWKSYWMMVTESFRKQFQVFLASTSMRMQQEFEAFMFEQNSQAIQHYAFGIQSWMRHTAGWEDKDSWNGFITTCIQSRIRPRYF